MLNRPKRPVKAAKAVIDRLFQMRQLWEDAANSYFEPQRFMLSLQNCITTSRTVTFILQSNKADFANFDAWFKPYRERWGADPIMRWARDARNSIEKRGDLETHSQVRGEIIASYLKGPETTWMAQSLFASPRSLWRAIPARFHIPHVIEHGTLLVERRWVDSELPDTEVLEALAHVYAEFCVMLIDLLEVHEMTQPPQIERSRPDVMGELAMDRAMYLSMRDGSITGMRYYKNPMLAPGKEDRKQVAKRYGKKAGWSRLRKAETFRDIAEAFFENARVLMARDGMHHNMTFLMKGKQPIEIAKTDHPTRASRYVLMRDLSRLARIAGADGIIMIGEAWTAGPHNVPPSGFAVEAEGRGEAISLHAANSSGESFVLNAVVERKRPGGKKIKRVGPAEFDDQGFQFLFMPFFEAWDCVDKAALTRMDEAMANAGIEDPVVNAVPR